MNESILQQFNCCVSCYFIAFFTVFLTLFMSSPSSHKKLESPLVSTVLDFHYFSVRWMLKIVGKSIKIRV